MAAQINILLNVRFIFFLQNRLSSFPGKMKHTTRCFVLQTASFALVHYPLLHHVVSPVGAVVI
jgi:hypothetical protein